MNYINNQMTSHLLIIKDNIHSQSFMNVQDQNAKQIH